jgi:hypothetical protein
LKTVEKWEEGKGIREIFEGIVQIKVKHTHRWHTVYIEIPL